MEQRNEGFVTTAAQSQSRVLAIEQEKVTIIILKAKRGLFGMEMQCLIINKTKITIGSNYCQG